MSIACPLCGMIMEMQEEAAKVEYDGACLTGRQPAYPSRIWSRFYHLCIKCGYWIPCDHQGRAP